MTTTRKQLPLNPSAIKTRFTYQFLRALKRLNKNRLITSSSTSKNETCRISHKVKMAAYVSMASAVGSRRTWSRALLWRIRNRRLISRRAVIRRSKRRVILRRSSTRANPREDFGYGEASRLRKLVPGGEVMDVCSLLDETAHYIKCLTMQVQVWERYYCEGWSNRDDIHT